MHTALALAALAVAAPVFAQGTDNPAWEEANRELAWRVQEAVENDHEHIERRDVADVLDDSKSFLIGGNEDYKPYTVPCPQGVNWIRSARDGISQNEKDYIAKRQPAMDQAFQNMMSKAGLSQMPPRTPVVALSLSGGGYRAMINGLGMTQGMMSQSQESSDAGTGGWIDAASYMAGLSGGSWATGSFMANGGMLPTDLLQNVLNLDSNLIFPADGKVSFYYNMLSNVRAKAAEGFPTQITDYWALALGDHLLPSQWRLDTSPNITFSALKDNIEQLQNAQLPVPIIIAAEREPGEVVVPSNSTVWEFTPWEYGSWAIGQNNNKTAGFFTPIEYLGTRMSAGQPVDMNKCYKGFDQMSFVMGTSSTLFNGGLLQLAQLNSSGVVDLVKDILSDVAMAKNDVAQYVNFAANYTELPNAVSNLEYLTMVDAGETNQNIPIEPLLMPGRQVDAIIAFDNSADTTYSWPNGSSLWTTYDRALKFQQDFGITIRMPKVPTTNGFVNQGLNQRPVFFGCNQTDTPMVVYVPHYPWTWYSNSSTYQLQYDTPTALKQMENAMRSVTLNGTVPEWPKCLACAMSDRAFGYTAANRSQECQECFNTWCWDGQDMDQAVEGEYEPLMGVTPKWLAEKGLSNNVQTAGITLASATSAESVAKPLIGGASIAAALVAATLGAVMTVLH
jgi:lysophospholipase